MRREQKQQKQQQAISIPENLLEFLQHVHEMIETEDESAQMESDDLLQCECAYGGLNDPESQLFCFTYFPETLTTDKNRRYKWELDLDSVDIANICEGSIQTLKLWECQNLDCRSLFSDPEDSCFYCDYVEVKEVE